MPHRRLVLLCAFTVLLAVVAFAVVVVDGRARAEPISSRRPLPALEHVGTEPSYLTGLDSALADEQVRIGALIAAEQAAAARLNPRPRPVPTGPDDVLAAIGRHFDGDLYGQAVRVASCESTLHPDSVSAGGGNWGLFQINTTHEAAFKDVTGHPWTDVLDANLNAEFARWLYDQSGGWGPWACRWAA